MYEKPQYLTAQGFKRIAKNPQKQVLLKKSALLRNLNKKGKKGISKEAAKIIAKAIQGMLKQ